MAEEIRRSVEAHTFERDDVSARTTISIGVASYPEDGTTHQELTHAADAALYRAKRAGGQMSKQPSLRLPLAARLLRRLSARLPSVALSF